MWSFVLRRMAEGAIGTAVLSLCLAYGQNTVSSSTHPLYRNRAFDFDVAVPPGVIYTRTLPPNPDHGLGITLKNRTKLWVDASYTDSSSTEQEAEKQIAGCRVEDKRPTTLGRMPAVLMRFSCAATPYDAAYSEELVLSVYQSQNRSPVCYQVGVRKDGGGTTSQEDDLFKKLVAGFSVPK